MPRQLLDEAHIHPAVQSAIGGQYRETIDEVLAALSNHPLVIVGMAQNPFCKKVRKNLDAANLSYHYLEYGHYFKAWEQRLALKMWSGWGTFPMVFVQGQLIGGNQEVEGMLASGELAQLLKQAA